MRVSATWKVLHASPAVSATLVPVAPSTSPQSSPSASQRCHWYAAAAASTLVHVPGVTVSVPPGAAGPVIAGGAVLTGTFAATKRSWICAAVSWSAKSATSSTLPASAPVNAPAPLPPSFTAPELDAGSPPGVFTDFARLPFR